MTRPTIHAVNLSRGWLCPHFGGFSRQLLMAPGAVHQAGSVRFTRIQSTWCEQKHWDDVVSQSLGPDIWMHLAQGHRVVVHDQSEKNRETRACWQGLQLIRYAAERAWNVMDIREYAIYPSRSGFDQHSYFAGVYEKELSSNTLTGIKYWKNFRDQLGYRPPVRLSSCWGSDGSADIT